MNFIKLTPGLAFTFTSKLKNIFRDRFRALLIRVRLTLSLHENCLAIFSITDIKSCGFPIP
jgi:hypothetical protein